MTVPRTICFGFLVLIAVGTLLLLLPFSTASGEWNSPLVALFTATSAVCVTGLIVVDTGSYFSTFGQGVVLMLIQLGGLGYMTATTLLLLLIGRRLCLKDKLAIQQAMDTSELSNVKALLVSIIAMTAIFELTGAFCLLPTFLEDFSPGQSLWLAIFHSISAFNNAGFSLFSDSLVRYAEVAWPMVVISVLIVMGGIGYQVIMEGFMWLRSRLSGRKTHTVFSLHFKIVTSTTLALLALGTLAFFLIEFDNPATLANKSFSSKLLLAGFQSVVMRTAGFNSIDIGSMETSALFVAIALMFVGASPGSTGGGIKTTTVRILVVSTKAALRGKEEVNCYQRQIPLVRVLKALAVVVASVISVVIITTCLSLSDPNLRFIDLLFETVSAFATVGVSTAATGDLSIGGQLFIICTMYIGRVGILLLMSALLGDPSPSAIHFPEEDLLTG
ncbi:Cation transport protein, putative [Synechococcus sp. PCC 7335]|uniref:TrkH family potassium uptake protein n=1 Tax=Synechococcus sp. (strain ATCC 29403 / PCC 7335) TaxID=91464 RepID=UPI00017EE70E|nr:TrkH family potassium uptake protein [Synechococcus sp. PCC 7335]EDX84357.1 Cation transport protein, putative [Synechococcus sp. PCC 7335]